MSHRKADVEIDDEDQFFDEEAAGLPLPELEHILASKSNEVRNALSRGNISGALQAALSQPPTGGRDVEPIKERTTALVMDAISAARPTDIAGVVKDLSRAQLDTLMKYLYRGMASPEVFNSAVLLSWHEKVFELGGLGSIVRVLTDRQSV